MASKRQVGQVLAILGSTFPRDVTPELVGVWLEAFDDVSDEALGAAARRAVKTCRFFPNPAELRDMIGANAAPAVDAEAILTAIWAFHHYHPQYGTTPPGTAFVRERFGDAIGQAYGLAGPARLYSGNETTASIARREFAKELEATVQQQGALALPAELPRLGSGDASGAVTFDAPRVGGGFRRLGSGVAG